MTTGFRVASGRANLACNEAGEGPAVVFLHAGVADRRMWRDQIDYLAESHRLVAYDRRGFGETRYRAEAFSHAGDLLALLDQLAIPQAVLVGSSQGGRVAIDFALSHPGRVSGMFLVAPDISGAPSTEDFPPAVEAVLELLEQAEEEEDLDRINLLEAWLWLDGPASEEGRVGGAVRDLFLEMNAIALDAPDPGLEENPAAKPPAYARLAQLGQPTQVIWGDRDFPDRQQLCVHIVQSTLR